MDIRFKPSINIKYDYNTINMLEYYIPTSTHIDVINSVCRGVVNSKSHSNHLVIGAYGTGKSLLGLLLANVVSKKLTSNQLSQIQSAFSKYDDEVSTLIDKVNSNSMTYLPILLNGNEGSFENAVLKNTLEVLQENEIEIELSGKNKEIINTINLWGQDYPETLNQFENLISEETEYNAFIKKLEQNNRNAIELFEKNYSKVTAGAIFNYISNDNFIVQIEKILKQLAEKNIGLIFLYDEFGRFLQTLPEDKTYQAMQYIQDFAELLDHGVNNGQLVIISHKDMRLYFHEDSSFKSEFERIEKRFKKHYIQTNTNMFYSIAQNVVTNVIEGVSELNSQYPLLTDVQLDYQIEQLRKYPMFSLNATEQRNLLIEGCYPIHPVTLKLITPLSNVFGQNERTLFTFLDGTDTSSLIDHIKNNNSMYTPELLFNYFFPSRTALKQLEANHSILKVYLKNIAKIPRSKDKDKYNRSVQLLKFITLWQSANLQVTLPLTDEFISYALLWDEETTTESLNRLKDLRVLRFNRLLEQWEIFEGSSINIDKEIALEITNLELTDSALTSVLKNFSNKNFFTSDNYNLYKKMIRFANVDILTDHQFLNLNAVNESVVADAYVYYIIPTTKNLNKLIDKISVMQRLYPYHIYCIVPFIKQYFLQEASKVLAIDNLLNKNELLALDSYVKVELEIEKSEADYYLRNKVKQLFKFDDEQKWFLPNTSNSIQIKNEVELKNNLSELFFSKYKDTPIINNEAFNRRYIPTVQFNASKKVVDYILQNPMIENFGIVGKGPDYLIYATTFKNNGIKSALDYNVMPKNDLFKLRRVLLDKINTTEKLSEVVAVLRNEPFGIRESLIPVLLVGLLQDIWPNLMFFNKGQYISRVTSNELHQMINDASSISFKINDFDSSDFEFFNFLTDAFSEHISEFVKDKAIHIQASSALLSWLQSLPRYTQVSSKQPEELLVFKTYVRRLEVDPKDSLEWLKDNQLNIINYKQNIELWFAQQIDYVYNQISVENKITSLSEWAQEAYRTNKDNDFIKSIVDTDNIVISEFINELSYKLLEFYATDWTDGLAQVFINTIVDKIKEANETEFDESKYVSLQTQNQAKYIMRTELTPRAKSLQDNLMRMINSSGKRITTNELEYILYSIVNEKMMEKEED